MNPFKPLRSSKSHGSLSLAVSRDKTRACDACRTKKSRCDGPVMPDGICSRCIKQEKPCTYVASSVPRGPPKAYITGLEDRMENIELLIKRLRPEIDLMDVLGPPIPRGAWRTDTPADNSDKQAPPSFPRISPHVIPTPALDLATHRFALDTSRSPSSTTARKPSELDNNDEKNDDEPDSADEHSSDSDTPHQEETLTGVLPVTVVSQDTRQPENRYHGSSGVFNLAPRIRRLRLLHLASLDPEHSIRPQVPLNFGRRSYFWTSPSWEIDREHRSEELLLGQALRLFPPPSLCKELVELYFIHFHPFYPMLHRISWDRHWENGLHLNNVWFAAVCLGMFAIAAKFAKDPRVLPSEEREKSEPNWQTAGLMWADMLAEIQQRHQSVLVPASLFEVQTYPLYALYQRSTKHFANSWITTATGLLKLYDVGVHSRTVYQKKPTLDQELWKRVFYSLYILDKFASAGAGRPFACRDVDFDVEFPLDVDDEFLSDDHPTHPFKQPQSKYSYTTFFIHCVKLCKILGDILNVLYGDATKSNITLATDRETQIALRRVNDAMLQWQEDLPYHLKWTNQTRINDSILSNQSFTLATAYHGTHSLIYRPFFTFDDVLPFLPPQHEKLPFPARALTTNHARALCQVTKDQIARGCSNIWAMVAGAHTAASLLLVTVWQLKRERKKLVQEGMGDSLEVNAISERIDMYLADAQVMFDSLEYFEPRWEVITPYLEKLKSSVPRRDDSDIEPSVPTTSPSMTSTTTSPSISSMSTMSPTTSSSTPSGSYSKVEETSPPGSRQIHPWVPARPVMNIESGSIPSIVTQRTSEAHQQTPSQFSPLPLHPNRPPAPQTSQRRPSVPSFPKRLSVSGGVVGADMVQALQSTPGSRQLQLPQAPQTIIQHQPVQNSAAPFSSEMQLTRRQSSLPIVQDTMHRRSSLTQLQPPPFTAVRQFNTPVSASMTVKSPPPTRAVQRRPSAPHLHIVAGQSGQLRAEQSPAPIEPPSPHHIRKESSLTQLHQLANASKVPQSMLANYQSPESSPSDHSSHPSVPAPPRRASMTTESQQTSVISAETGAGFREGYSAVAEERRRQSDPRRRQTSVMTAPLPRVVHYHHHSGSLEAQQPQWQTPAPSMRTMPISGVVPHHPTLHYSYNAPTSVHTQPRPSVSVVTQPPTVNATSALPYNPHSPSAGSSPTSPQDSTYSRGTRHQGTGYHQSYPYQGSSYSPSDRIFPVDQHFTAQNLSKESQHTQSAVSSSTAYPQESHTSWQLSVPSVYSPKEVQASVVESSYAFSATTSPATQSWDSSPGGPGGYDGHGQQAPRWYNLPQPDVKVEGYQSQLLPSPQPLSHSEAQPGAPTLPYLSQIPQQGSQAHQPDSAWNSPTQYYHSAPRAQ